MVVVGNRFHIHTLHRSQLLTYVRPSIVFLLLLLFYRANPTIAVNIFV